MEKSIISGTIHATNSSLVMSTLPKLFVNVACGRLPEEGFTNLDNSMFLKALPIYKRFKYLFPRKYHKNFDESWIPLTSKFKYKRHNCIKSLPFKNNSIDHIVCSHFIEHVYPNQANKILDDFFKKLKEGGTLHIIVPDLKYMATEYINSKKKGSADHFISEAMQCSDKQPSYLYRLLESTGKFGLEHRWMYDEDNLSTLIKQSSFKIISPQENMPSKRLMDLYNSLNGNLQIHAIKD